MKSRRRRVEQRRRLALGSAAVPMLLAFLSTGIVRAEVPRLDSETVAKETVAKETVAKETVAKETVAKETVAKETVPNSPVDTSANRLSTEFAEEPGSDSSPISSGANLDAMSEFALEQAESWITPDRMSSSAQVFITMALLGLIPALLLMTTSYVRVVVVLGLLRQAFGAQQMLPAQVTTAIAMFITVLVMWPTWERVYHDAVEPYTNEEIDMSVGQAWQAAERPIREFMSSQIRDNQNSEDVWLFLRYLPDVKTPPTVYDEVPLRALLPAFMLSELKTAFLIGFGIYLPFLVIDLFVSAVTTSMGMFMLPPAMISMPLKLLLFVLVDGWNLVVGMLLESFQTYA